MRLTIILLFICQLLTAQYYVTPSGSSANDGLSEANAWSFTHADNNAPSFSTVNVKAGNYGGVSINLINDNVVWRGYNSTPNDITTENASSYVYPNAISSSLLPTLTGSDKTGIGLTISGFDITLENFQVVNFERGVRVNGGDAILKNIVTHNQGTEGTSEIYSGVGIEFRAANGTLTNSHAQNAGAEGIVARTNGNNTRIDYCTVISDRPTSANGLDYYIAIFNVDNCLVTNSTVRQINDTHVGRHGFVIKESGTNNIFRDCYAENVNCEANFEQVFGNVWENIEMVGTSGYSGSEDAARIRISNGAHDNKFINVSCTNCWTYVGFADWDDGLYNPGNATGEIGMGDDNIFINSVANNVKNFITFEVYENTISTTANDNVFISPTVNNARYLFRTAKVGNNTQIINAALKDVTDLQQSGMASTLQSNTVFENINLDGSFSSSDLTPFIESNITTIPFSFVDAENGDFNISNNVLNIGQDVSLIDLDANKDFRGSNRTVYTLGAYEFGYSVTDLTKNKKAQIRFINTIRTQ